jgi:hypothetical protein
VGPKLNALHRDIGVGTCRKKATLAVMLLESGRNLRDVSLSRVLGGHLISACHFGACEKEQNTKVIADDAVAASSDQSYW